MPARPWILYAGALVVSLPFVVAGLSLGRFRRGWLFLAWCLVVALGYSPTRDWAEVRSRGERGVATDATVTSRAKCVTDTHCDVFARYEVDGTSYRVRTTAASDADVVRVTYDPTDPSRVVRPAGAHDRAVAVVIALPAIAVAYAALATWDRRRDRARAVPGREPVTARRALLTGAGVFAWACVVVALATTVR